MITVIYTQAIWSLNIWSHMYFESYLMVMVYIHCGGMGETFNCEKIDQYDHIACDQFLATTCRRYFQAFLMMKKLESIIFTVLLVNLPSNYYFK